ncbi:tetratricopeptide repeat protein [Pseudomonas chlororaphis]|uniref:Sel1 repeat family protein n=1 Tax=Pseudomonas chlororaphis TaxID=587753 RepID=A0AAX3FMK9_9PSED|nr:sel1 repeat family protein [Pseudomonas chlororaphis]AZC37459.1 hypothetical protein C4K37_3072 [Pseudomonas chlororaphis subsp. piscium]AZC44008.1 hypothetical protein C4K36_3083 [Pseudomonas chlororaphis subsp. piscium]WDG75857.1 sel1 repeat family protein [Pseudomonas chlororaphis]WDH26508.1 sel1 repeat family protein [Pseudomonas chlororaphis]WDH74375.1 sel1 repeat family protein [Pseudomonas chlororaphis]
MRVLPVIVGLFWVLFLTQANAQLSAEQQTAKERGLILHNQYKVAKPELTLTAKAGDRDSQFYLAEELRRESQYITPEAYQWYIAAAEQGDYYAMFRLATSKNDLCQIVKTCPKGNITSLEWLKKLRSMATAQSEEGESEAMYVMYLATGELEWLKKSAEAGYAQGQRLLANRYKEGEGFFLPWRRDEAIGRWLKASAEGGSPKGMLEYAAYIYESRGDLAIARHWIEEAAKSGYEPGVTSYGAYLAHAPSLYDFPLDLIKGYALTSLLTELDGGGNIQAYVDQVLPEIAEKMSQQQIKEAEIFAKTWKATHPPLSFFPPKLGF